MDVVAILGYASGVLTTVAFVPQVLRVLKTRSTEDLSLGMYATFCTGVFGWWIYGLLLQAWPIVAANTITFILAMIILFMKIKHG